jgi:PAS domain S-box-containing protein
MTERMAGEMAAGADGVSHEAIRVLLIDDQPITEKLVRRMLQGEADIELHYCQDPRQAVQMAERVRPTIILLDLVMPELDGMVLLERLRQHRVTSQTPIVMLSTEDNPQVKARAFAIGASNYLVKLPDRVEMVARLRYHARNFLRVTRKAHHKETCLDVLTSEAKGFWLIDVDTGTVFDVNETLCTVLEMEPREIIGRKPSEFVQGEDLDSLAVAMDWLPRPDKRVYEVYLLNRTHRKIYTRFCVTVSFNTLNRRAVAAFTFVNPVHWLTNRPTEHHLQFRLLSETIPGMIWMADSRGNRIYFNPGWLEFTGRILEQEMDDGWQNGVHPDDLPMVLENVGGGTSTMAESFSMEYRLRSRDGAYRWVFEIGLPHFTQQRDQVIGYTGSCIDITERKRVEEQLQRFNQDLEAKIAERTVQLVHEIEVRKQAEQQERQMRQAKGLISRLLRIALRRIPLQQQLERALETIIDSEFFSLQRMGCIALHDQVNGGWVPVGACDRCVSLPAGYAPVAPDMLSSSIGFENGVYTIPIASGDVVLGVLQLVVGAGYVSEPFHQEILVDMANALFTIIDRKQKEQFEKEKLAAEAANQAKSAFLATMSHEIRTPMNAILGLGELLLETPLNEEQRHMVTVSHQAGTALLSLINDILDLSKIEANQFDLECLRFDLPAMVQETVDIFSLQAHEKGVELQCWVDPAVARWMLGDPGRLRQVLLNLCSNALKFTATGTVAVGVHDKGECVDGSQWIEFSVADTGIGVRVDKLDAIFEPFVQADSSTTRMYGGTGLGLSICRRLVDRMRGTIWVTSVPDEGSLFQFMVPLMPMCRDDLVGSEGQAGKGTADAVRHAEMWPVPAPRSLDLLLVEDAEDNQFLIQAFLKHTPHRLTVARDGLEGVETFMAGHYDVVLMDIQMPRMDGYEATRRIRAWETARGRFPPSRIVALTAHALRDVVELARDAGCDDYLAKPVRKKDLLELVDRYAREPTAGPQRDTGGKMP